MPRPPFNPLTSRARLRSGIGKPRPVFLLGYHGGRLPAQVSLYWGIGRYALDGALKVASAVLQLIRRECMQRMFGRFDGCGFGGHWRQFLTSGWPARYLAVNSWHADRATPLRDIYRHLSAE